MQWYYVKNGAQVGPVEDDALVALARTGELLPTDLVWTESMGDQWAPASSVQGLFEGQAAAAEATGSAAPVAAFPVATQALSGELTSNRDLMRMARESLSGQWGLAVAGGLVYFLISMVVGFIPMIGSILGWIIGGPLLLGFTYFFLKIARRDGAAVSQIFSGFNIFGKALVTYLLMMIFLFLWFLLLVIPGIIKSYSYAMTFFILADDPSVGAREAITRSRAMMHGRKLKLLCLFLRFIGWMLLCVLTLGIGMFWLWPYVQTSLSHFYDDVKDRPLA